MPKSKCDWCDEKVKHLIHVDGDPNDIGGDVCFECLQRKAEEAGEEYRFFDRLVNDELRAGRC